MARFGSVVTAMVTPFDDHGGLDVDGAVVLARHLIATGSDGLVLAGTTGEGPVLTDGEALDLFRAVAEAVTVPVIAATGSNDTAHSVTFTRSVADIGVDAVLIVTPYYNRPSSAGLSAHFRAVAAATDLPVLLYDIPIRTGRRIGSDLLTTLASEVPNIVGVKDATGDVAGAARVVAQTPEQFEVYSGDDSLTLPFLAVGGVGIVSVASHWAGRQWPRWSHHSMPETFGGHSWPTTVWRNRMTSRAQTCSPIRSRPKLPAEPWAFRPVSVVSLIPRRPSLWWPTRAASSSACTNLH